MNDKFMQTVTSGDSLLLGFIQGITEFLPVSSSGHLVIFQYFLGLREPQILFDVVLHFGTLLAVVLVYREDLKKILVEFFAALGAFIRDRNVRATWHAYPYFRLGIYLVIGTLPAAFTGVLFEDLLEKAFGSLSSAGAMLIFTGTVLFSTRWVTGKGKSLEKLTYWHALVIGIFQAMALLPGISRSGMTIAGGLFIGLNRDLAARFSFLLSVPAILGATILELHDALDSSASLDLVPFILGGVVAMVSGYLALVFLLRIVHKGNFSKFAYYCWPVGLGVLLYSILPN